MKQIYFWAESLPLIKLGFKTQTRRLVKLAAPPEILMFNRHLFIQVTSVYTEHLCDISLTDCIAEGCIPTEAYPDPLEHFKKIWLAIYGTRPGYAWENNPLIWVHHFHVVKSL